MVSRELELQLQGYGLTTAKILYRMPDHQSILQTFIWQAYDLEPDFPVMDRFLTHWRKSIEGPLFSVSYTHQKLIRPGEWRKVDGEIILH